MFNILEISDIVTDGIGLGNIYVSDRFFFTFEYKNYTNIYNKKGVIIGRVPYDYHMFFKFHNEQFFEDLSIDDLKRFIKQDIEIDILGYDYNTNKPIVYTNNDIGELEFVENTLILPFTNYAIEQEGLFVFKHINSLATALLDDIKTEDIIDY